MHYLVVTDSVHATAAACDYLEGRLADDDAVTVAAVDDEGRDPGDALNVATARLGARTDLSVDRLPADDPLERAALGAADDHAVDEIVLDARVAATGTDSRVADAVTRLLGRAAVPVAIVPRKP